MATINLMALEPHKVSRDLSGYITYIYGAAKTRELLVSWYVNIKQTL